MSSAPCAHVAAIETIAAARSYECEDCAKTGSRWVHLRTCQACGVTLCCDSSPNQHATAHARSTGHPVIASAEPGETWLYCYVDHYFKEL